MSDLAKTALLRRYTPARVGLARAGAAVGTEAQLLFQLDHALARDAVHARLDAEAMVRGIEALGLRGVALHSAAGDRTTYLRRPDLGRKLSAESAAALPKMERDAAPEIALVLADGLSALAVERHALALIEVLLPLLSGWSVGPVSVVSEGRVAVGDEIGELLGARLTVMLIGERPGLSAADSLGIYMTWAPRLGRMDSERNCISNVRAGGLSYAEAASRLIALMAAARSLELSGVDLKLPADAAAMLTPGKM